jgi:outer membrane protein TolC
MTASRMKVSDALRNAYRGTFGEYADKLKTLQRLMNDGAAEESQIEAARRDVEEARGAYSQARDRLAKELMRRAAQTGAPDEQQIRKTARLIWEFAGRPEGTAERDWQEAERFLRAASAC